MIQNKLECKNCRKSVSPTDIMRLKWKKQNKYVDLCPVCAHKFFNKHMKENKFTDDILMRSGFKAEGAKEYDVKSLLEKWSKKKILKS